MTGAVISIQPASHQATIQHRAIAGLMEAMTMPYLVRDDAELKKLSAGDQIDADLMVNKETGEMWLTNVRITKPAAKK
jgi:protein SCO1/2